MATHFPKHPKLEFENSLTPKKEDTDSHQIRNSDTRRSTRSQIAPDWTPKDSLILVNEIFAVEAECLKALSSYQKWEIIAENCNALEVHRNAYQCRRKWDSLLNDYKKIRQWESKSGFEYVSLGIEKRKELGLAQSFDTDLFKAMDDLVRAQEERSDTDPDSDPEAEAEIDVDVLDVVPEPAPRRKRRRPLPQKSEPVDVKPQKTEPVEVKPQAAMVVKMQEPKSIIEAKQEPSNIKEAKQEPTIMEISIEDEERTATKLRENADLVHTILRGSAAENQNPGLSDTNSLDTYQTELARRRADKLITCLGIMLDNLNHLVHPVQHQH